LGACLHAEATLPLPALCLLGYRGRVHTPQLVIALPFTLAFGLAAHALLSRLLKTVLWAWSPLATGEPEAATYERRVYHSADMPMMQIMAAAALSGLPFWAALATGKSGWWWWGSGAVCAVVALDLTRWERVAVSIDHLWFQRGFSRPVHQVVLENIRDVSIEEAPARGFTLRHGLNNRLVRLKVRMKDRRVVALPKTDAEGGLEAVENVANHLRMRLDQIRQRRGGGLAKTRALPAGASPQASAAPDDEELHKALARLRRGAALKRLAS